jgi:hypothetical protein
VAVVVLVVGTVVGCGGDSDAEESDRPATNVAEAPADYLDVPAGAAAGVITLLDR